MCDTVVVASSSDGARVRVSTMVIAMNGGREEASMISFMDAISHQNRYGLG